MCGPKFCSMHHSRTIDDGIAQLAKEMAEKESAQGAGAEAVCGAGTIGRRRRLSVLAETTGRCIMNCSALRSGATA